MEKKVYNEIRSFAMRGGRVSAQRRKLVEENSDEFCIDMIKDQPLVYTELFGNNNPVTVEIGFGMGDSPLHFAKMFPEKNLLGLEVHFPGVARLVNLLQQDKITNVRIIREDAVQIIKHGIADNSIAAFHIFFPDPWPKTKHNKRRLLQKDLIELLTDKLVIGGYICCATDWEEYGLQMHQLLEQNNRLAPKFDGGFCDRPDFRPVTRFEQKGLDKNHRIINLIYDKLRGE